MTLTIADTRVVEPIELTQLSREIYSDTLTLLGIIPLIQYFEIHQIEFSIDSTSGSVKLGQVDGLNYLILREGVTTAINYDFSSAPLLFAAIETDIYVDPGGILTDIFITLWYRHVRL